MTTPSNAFSESTVAAQAAAPAVVSATRPWYWSVRRELWENRSIYVGPLAVAAVYLSGFLISLARLPHRVRALAWLDQMHQRHAISRPAAMW